MSYEQGMGNVPGRLHLFWSLTKEYKGILGMMASLEGQVCQIIILPLLSPAPISAIIAHDQILSIPWLCLITADQSICSFIFFISHFPSPSPYSLGYVPYLDKMARISANVFRANRRIQPRHGLRCRYAGAST